MSGWVGHPLELLTASHGKGKASGEAGGGRKAKGRDDQMPLGQCRPLASGERIDTNLPASFLQPVT